MHAEFIRPGDSRWLSVLSRAAHDIYQLPEYAVVAGHHEGGEPVAFYASDGRHEVLMPLLVRELPDELDAAGEWRDATSPYGYAGPVATIAIPLETLRCAYRQFRELARQQGLVSAFIRLHPLRPDSAAGLEEVGAVVNHGAVVYIDLSKSLDELWADTRSNHRRNITRLGRMGYRVELDDWSAYPEFRRLYRVTMQRRSAAAFYYFSDAYFEELRERLGEHMHLCVVRGPSGDAAAAGLFMVADDLVEYHLGGTAEAHLTYAPSKLMFDFARSWAKALGAKAMNLGGGVGGSGDSLQQFKTGFSSARADFRTVRVVFDEQRYERFTAASRARVDAVAEAFFPAYRQPPRAAEPGV